MQSEKKAKELGSKEREGREAGREDGKSKGTKSGKVALKKNKSSSQSEGVKLKKNCLCE